MAARKGKVKEEQPVCVTHFYWTRAIPLSFPQLKNLQVLCQISRLQSCFLLKKVEKISQETSPQIWTKISSK